MNEVMKRHVDQAIRTINYDFEIADQNTFDKAFIRFGKSVFENTMDKMIADVDAIWWNGYMEEKEAIELKKELKAIKINTLDELERKCRMKLGATEYFIQFLLSDGTCKTYAEAYNEVGRMNS